MYLSNHVIQITKNRERRIDGSIKAIFGYMYFFTIKLSYILNGPMSREVNRLPPYILAHSHGSGGDC